MFVFAYALDFFKCCSSGNNAGISVWIMLHKVSFKNAIHALQSQTFIASFSIKERNS